MPPCRRAEGAPTKISRHIWYRYLEYAGLKNGELVLTGVFGGDCIFYCTFVIQCGCHWNQL